jgi:hypothetical protein
MKNSKNRNILPYVGFGIRIFFALFAMAIAVLFFQEMLKKVDDRYSFALCFLIPVIAAVIIGGDLYMRWKLDIRPLREAKKNRKKISV